MQERTRRENSAQVLICNREELKMLALREHRNRESIAEVIKHQSTPEVDFEFSNREELKRRALEERRLTWVRTESKIIVHPTVTSQDLYCSTTRSMITIDAGERNRNRNRRKERTSNSSTGPSFGTKRLGGV
jgi:hypothetical protein